MYYLYDRFTLIVKKAIDTIFVVRYVLDFIISLLFTGYSCWFSGSAYHNPVTGVARSSQTVE